MKTILYFLLTTLVAWHTQARTLTWTGASFSNPTWWSLSANWNPTFVPVDGDVLIFPGSAITSTSFNDLVGLHVFSITFNGSSGSTLNGNPIFLDSAITAAHTSGRARVNFDLTFTTGAVTFYTLNDGYLDIEQDVFLGNNDLYLYPISASPSGTNIEVHGIITGAGGLTKLGEGDAHLMGVWPNEYTGVTTVQRGKLHLSKSGVPAISNRLLVVGDHTIFGGSVIDHASGQYPPGLAVTLSNCTWEVHSSTTVTNLSLSEASIIGSGTLSLLSDVTVFHGGDYYGSSSSIHCSLYLGTETRTFLIDPTFNNELVDLTLVGAVNGPEFANNSPGIIKQGYGRLLLQNANTYFGPTVVKEGRLVVESSVALGSFTGDRAGTTVEGGDIELYGGVTLSEPIVMAGGTLYFNGTTTLNGSLVLSNSTQFRGGSLLQVNSTISGPGNFTFSGCTVRLAGSSPNTFGTGSPNAPVLVYSYSELSVLELAKSGDVVAVPVPIELGGFAGGESTLRNLQSGGVSDVRIDQGGAWLLNGNTASPNLLTFRGAGYVDTQGGTLYLGLGNTTARVQVVSSLPSNFTAQILGNVGLLQATNEIFITNGPTLNINGIISGSGHLLKRGAGKLVLSGNAGNSWDGNALVNEGTLELSKSFLTPAVLGNLVLGPATAAAPAVARFFQSGLMNPAATVTVNANGLLDLNGNNQTLSRLNLNDGGAVATGAGALSFTGSKTIAVGTQNPSPPGLRASSFISGNLALPTFDDLVFNVTPYDPGYVSATPTLDVSANISGNGNIVMNGLGEMRLGGNNTFDATPSVLTGEIYLNGGIIFAASPTALGGTGGSTYLSGGSMLVLSGGITINNEALHLNSINLPALDSRVGTNTWNGPIVLGMNSAVSANQPSDSLHILGVVSGPGSLTKMGAGNLRLGGPANNTHAGNTFVHEGRLELAKSASAQAVPHDLIIGSGQLPVVPTLVRHLNPDQVWAKITVNAGGLLDVNVFDEYSGDVTLNGGGDVQSSTGTFYLGDGVNLTVNPNGSTDPATISGRLGLFPGLHRLIMTNGVAPIGQFDLNIPASIVQFSTAASVTVEGNGRTRLGGTNTYTGKTLVSSGTLALDGSQPQSSLTVQAARLEGRGIAGPLDLSGDPATRIAPGGSPGILTCSNLTGGLGILEIELNGPTPDSGYDQLNVRGNVKLTGLALSPSLNFVSSVGQTFTIVDNDGSNPVNGTFTGLPQNKKLYIGQELFQISYTGGSGNDVVLTRLVTPPPPVLTIERVPPSSVRLIWATNDPPFRLQFNTNLITPTWIAATPSPVVVSTDNIVTNTASEKQTFYRLITP